MTSSQFPLVLTCPAGAEQLAREEAAALGIRGTPVVETGRVRFKRASLRDAAVLALWHRTSERVWVVAAEFRARHRNELIGGARTMELGRFVEAGAEVHLRVDTHRSRLHHKGAVAEWFAEGSGVVDSHAKPDGEVDAESESDAESKLDRGADSDAAPDGDSDADVGPESDADSEADAAQLPTVALRLDHDACEVWIDARGPAKGKRGWREHIATAPLAEPAAAAVLRAVGWKPSDALFDPCCGAGTLVLEAARQSRGATVLAHREPMCFGWAVMAGGTLAAARQAAPAIEPAAEPTDDIRFRGYDVSEAAIRAARHNAVRADCGAITSFDVADACAFFPGKGRGWIITNPPWGQRLGKQDLRTFRQELGERLRQLDRGWRIAVLEPSPTHAQQLLGNCKQVLRIRCGGISAGVFVKDGR